MSSVVLISIHALREEGDDRGGNFVSFWAISIHALREEGDYNSLVTKYGFAIFLSTPSARRATECFKRRIKPNVFLSTPSARRAT